MSQQAKVGYGAHNLRKQRKFLSFARLTHPTIGTSSLSDLTLIYCGKADFDHFVCSFLLNRTTISLKRAQKLPQNGLLLATTG
jgi:hypothetical protein